MTDYNKFNSHIGAVYTKKHDFSADTFKFMLTNTLPTGSETAVSQITEITAENGYAAGGVTIEVTYDETAGTVTVTQTNDEEVVASGGTVGPFQAVVFYNSTAAATVPPISWWPYAGGSITLQDGEGFAMGGAGLELFSAV